MWKAQFAAGVALAGLAPSAALAQQSTPPPRDEAAPADEQAIIVTGTSIRGVAAPASQSIQLNREDLLESGAATSTEIARTLPQVVNIGADESRRGGAQDAAANGTRTSGINLRGLSSEATLLLLNGRRLAPNGTIKALADPSMIPAIALERLEIVPDGASAIYGADAVAGVVNMITRRPANLAEVQLRYGAGDSLDQMQGSAIAGRTWDGGGIIAAYEYYYRSNLRAADRDFTSSDLRRIGGTDQRSTLAAPGNILVSGVRYGLPDGNGRNLTAAQLTAGRINYFDAGVVGDLLPEQERHSVFVTAFQDVTDRLRVTYEGFYSARNFFENVVNASSTLTVPRSNPFFVHPTNPAAPSVQVEYRFVDVNRRPNWTGFDIGWQNTLGLRYDLDGGWQVNAYAALNKNRGRQRTENLLNTVFLPMALADSNPATAFNPFGNGAVANNNPETMRKMLGIRDSKTVNDGRDFVIKADGPIFALPGGDVRVAIGAEYHESELRYTILSSLKNAANDLLLDRDRSRERNNKAVFGELYLPLFSADNATPGFQQLTLQMAGRYESYSDFGETFNPKVGMTWTPIDGVQLRGSWGTSFRAPSLIDSSDALFNVFIQNFTDNGVVKRAININGGRNDLAPETADTWAVGGDFKPSMIPGFSASVTYYNIKYKNVIEQIAANTIVANPGLYGAYINRTPTLAQIEAYMNSPNLESPRENPANIVMIVDSRRDNRGRLEQDGIDIQLSQRLETAAGTFNLGFFLTQILNSNRTVSPGIPLQNALNLITFPVDTRIRGNLGWRDGPVSANLFWNHTGDYENNLVTPSQRVRAYNTFDASISYKFGDTGPLNGLQITLSGQNLFDRPPPDVINGTMAWDSQNASPIGRFVALDLRKSF